MISLRGSRIVFEAARLAGQALAFRERGWAVFPNIVGIDIISSVFGKIDNCTWKDKLHRNIGKEIIPDDDSALNFLLFIFNAPSVMASFRELFHCEGINWFDGRIYRFVPGTDHHDSWHTDCTQGRRVGMSLNLSPNGFEGGQFELRRRGTRETFAVVSETGLGDATVFRISENLEHRVSVVTGETPRTVFAGWFQEGVPDLAARVRQGRSDERIA